MRIRKAVFQGHAGLLAALFSISLLTAGCDGPSSATGLNGGTPGDSLDAQLGMGKGNRYEFLQGNLMATGHIMDLGIDGIGFFILKNGSQYVYFRRPASFTQDAEGYLTLGNAKTRLQGIPLYSNKRPYPNISEDSLSRPNVPLTQLVDIHWPFQELMPPRATSFIKLARNLDSDAEGKGAILYTQKFLHHAEASDLLVGLNSYDGHELGMQIGDAITVSAMADQISTHTKTILVTDGFTVANLNTAITEFLRSASVDFGSGTTADLVTSAENASQRGAITVYGNTRPIHNFQITSSRPVSGPNVTKAFAVPTDIPAGTRRLAICTNTFRSPAMAGDLLTDLFDTGGNDLGLENGDMLSVTGSIGDEPASNVAPLSFVAGPGGTTMADLLTKIKDNFKLADRDGTASNNHSISLDPTGSEDNIPDGAIVIRGQPGTAFTIKDLAILAHDVNNSKPSPNFFNTNTNATVLREAVDTQTPECSFSAYDESGKEHMLTIRFTPTGTPSQWLWEAIAPANAILQKGVRGTLIFGRDGSVASFATDTGDPILEFDPGNGLQTIRITMQAGGPKDFTGLTQFRSITTAMVSYQNGCPAGILRQISIGEDGIISGSYTNDQSRALFQIPLADFPNHRGLKLVGANSFLETAESGKAAVSVGLFNATGIIKPGALEYLTTADFKQVCDVYPECRASVATSNQP